MVGKLFEIASLFFSPFLPGAFFLHDLVPRLPTIFHEG